MKPIILVSDRTDFAGLENYFSKFGPGIDFRFDLSECTAIPGKFDKALVFVRLKSGSAIAFPELAAMFEGSEIRLVFLTGRDDGEIRRYFKNDVFAWLDIPIKKRELEMLICYYDKFFSSGATSVYNDEVYEGDYDSVNELYTDEYQHGPADTVILEKQTKLLKTGEEKHRIIFESMPMISVQGYNNRREIVYWNSASEQLYGYSREEAIGRRVEELIIPDELKEKVIQEISDYFLRNIEIPPTELSLLRKDGSRVYVYSSHLIFTNSSGRKELFSVDLDLTQIRRHQLIQDVLSDIAAATNTSENLQDFLETLRDSLSRVINTRNFFVALYNEHDNTFSLPVFVDDVDNFRSFPAGRTLTGYMIEKNKPLLLNESEIYALEKDDLIDRIGTPCKLWLGIPLRKDEKPVGALVFQSYTDNTVFDETDIRTLQIVAEQVSGAIERKARQEQLRESERAMRTLISNLPGIAYRCRLDKTWAMEFLSEGFTELTGYKVEDCIGSKEFSYADIIHPDDRNEVFEQISGATGRNESYHLIYRIIVDSSCVKWVWEKGSAVSDEFGNIIALEGFIIDITDRIEMEKQIIAAKEKAEEADRLKSAFLGNLSHEIRSPMNSIIGFSQLLKTEKIAEPATQYADIILQSSRQLLNVINDIVDMSKIDSGQILVRKTRFDICSLMNKLKNYTVDNLSLYPGRVLDIRLSLEKVTDDRTVYSDEKLVSQIMTHLINNALKFTESGSIEIGCIFDNDDVVTLYVRDTGIGISCDNHELIFERFRQVDERITRNFDGTGLGLAISKGMTLLLGGTIGVESQPGSGSCFYFSIPVK
jgi:PAS domain S-box-containing protein